MEQYICENSDIWLGRLVNFWESRIDEPIKPHYPTYRSCYTGAVRIILSFDGHLFQNPYRKVIAEEGNVSSTTAEEEDDDEEADHKMMNGHKQANGTRSKSAPRNGHGNRQNQLLPKIFRTYYLIWSTPHAF